RHLDQHGEFSEFGRRGPDSLHLYHAVHLSDDQPGRPMLLDSGLNTDAPRHNSVEQVFLRVGRFLGAVRRTNFLERYHAARADADRLGAPADVHPAVSWASVNRGRPGRDDAKLPRDVALKNRSRVRWHAQFGAERALYYRDRRAHRAAVPLLS